MKSNKTTEKLQSVYWPGYLRATKPLNQKFNKMYWGEKKKGKWLYTLCGREAENKVSIWGSLYLTMPFLQGSSSQGQLF